MPQRSSRTSRVRWRRESLARCRDRRPGDSGSGSGTGCTRCCVATARLLCRTSPSSAVVQARRHGAAPCPAGRRSGDPDGRRTAARCSSAAVRSSAPRPEGARAVVQRAVLASARDATLSSGHHAHVPDLQPGDRVVIDHWAVGSRGWKATVVRRVWWFWQRAVGVAVATLRRLGCVRVLRDERSHRLAILSPGLRELSQRRTGTMRDSDHVVADLRLLRRSFCAETHDGTRGADLAGAAASETCPPPRRTELVSAAVGPGPAVGAARPRGRR